jgi:signal transduction histidine kinase
MDIPHSLPELWADGNRLNQVLFNLLSNALKFNRRGGQITLRASASESYVKFEVQDEGIGISPEDKELLFYPDRRREKKQSYGGLGMGLILSKMFVELHHGDISVESELGQGSIFSFRIPLISQDDKGYQDESDE